MATAVGSRRVLVNPHGHLVLALTSVSIADLLERDGGAGRVDGSSPRVSAESRTAGNTSSLQVNAVNRFRPVYLVTKDAFRLRCVNWIECFWVTV